MRKLLLAGCTAGLLLLAGVASAAEITATITEVNVSSRIIIVEGRSFYVPESVNITVLKVGERVTIVYEVVDGQVRVTSIKVG